MTKIGGILGAIISIIGAIFMTIAAFELIFYGWNINTISMVNFIIRIISICLTFVIVAFVILAGWFQADEPGDTFTGGINLVGGFISLMIAFLGSLFNVQLIGYFFGVFIPSSDFLLVVSIDALFIMGGGAVGLL